MSRRRTVLGTYKKITGGDHNMSSEGHIISKAILNIGEKGAETGVTHNSFERLGSNINEDFEITFSRRKDKAYSTMVPLGILDFKGNYENAQFVFDYSLMLSNVDSLEFKILNEDGSVLYAITNLPTVTVVAAKRVLLLVEDLVKKKPKHDPLKPINMWDWKSIFDPYNITSGDYTKLGSYVIFWDGFDNNGIYDSTKFNNKKLKAQIVARKNGKSKTKEVEFYTEQIGADWVDVKIDKNNKRIDTKLRVNLKDGGEKGLKCSSYIAGGRFNPQWETKCPWDKISTEALNYYKKEPIKTKTISYEKLKEIALGGINKFWSRNSGNIGKGVNINGDLFEFFVDSKNDENGMVAPELIYFTNKENHNFNRSHNWEASRELYFKIGYTYYSDWKDYAKNTIVYVTKGWTYKEFDKAKSSFEETAAHEIGHQLLLSYGGHVYSKTHKDTSHWSMIIQEPNQGTKYPPKGNEIDLMKYAEEAEPVDYYKRVILAEKDALSLLWLCKIEIK